ncbi:MAG: hypothetical protein ACTS2F_17890 [Thainema sp.]
MSYLILGAASNAAPQPGATNPSPTQRDGRHPLRIILLGTRPDIIVTIKNLHRRGFAPADEWSQPIPCPSASDVARILAQRQPDDQISILTRYLSSTAYRQVL